MADSAIAKKLFNKIIRHDTSLLIKFYHSKTFTEGSECELYDGTLGTCKSLLQCKWAIDNYKTGKITLSDIRRTTCSYVVIIKLNSYKSIGLVKLMFDLSPIQRVVMRLYAAAMKDQQNIQPKRFKSVLNKRMRYFSCK